MRGGRILLAAVVCWLSGYNPARADDTRQLLLTRLDEASQAVSDIRASSSHVAALEREAKAQSDAVRASLLHRIVTRVTELLSVANQRLDDIRAIVSTRDDAEVIVTELERMRTLRSAADRERAYADEVSGGTATSEWNCHDKPCRVVGGDLDEAEDPVAFGLVLMTAPYPYTGGYPPPQSPF
jgi:hypothetical protein